ncbi:DNA polymerase-3 subunit gamma/tau [Sulfobacillus thermosulfidooxidans DSM 9293]|uniref:DNA-directed DNA polymerase n=1 Tax=Sulfobacillus thermosulfidooxidans (strain DSM 9293 / VKM B-1269 / AT-1) TaxID=929705 RepID=A0A1W1WBL1_SULTA|nr:DNA polymerase III subunit gamma/tau [Sulfobacillus thermosulfidooxidans]SMC03430.1 DNA polymerase-3 subunit gamma/tau [Sulfobacillus thermosulfidooxidans DSM 9293]
MAHQALYRIYRPRSFDEVIGQSRVVETLRQAVRQSRLTHAYLFAGPRGTGKTSVARILAKAIQCEALTEEGEPCLQCSACIAVEKGQHLDVLEIDAASNRGIDEIREIKERIDQSPVMGRYRIYIIDEVHMLTTEAFNALLKTLEEPPPHVIFVLATTEPQKLPVTVLSRCQRYEFQRLTVGLIEERIRQVIAEEHVQVEPAALELIAEYADGAMRDALSLLDQTIAVSGKNITYQTVSELVGTVEPIMMEQIMTALTSPTDLGDVMRTLDDIYRQGKDYRTVLRSIAQQIRDIVIWRQAGKDLFPQYRREWLEQLDARLPAKISAASWFHALELLAEADTRLRSGFPAQLSVELALLKIREELAYPTEPSSVQEERERAHRVTSPPKAAPVVYAEEAVHNPERVSSAPKSSADKNHDNDVAPIDSQDMSQDERLKLFLEAIRQERPSTYALLQEARLQVTPKALEVIFSFPAHRDLMMASHHKALLEQVLHKVYGPEMQYYLLVGNERPVMVSKPTAPPLSQNDRAALVDEIRSWFGAELPVKNIEESNEGGQ